MRVNFKKVGRSVRRWSRLLHRDLSYLLATLIFIYALSGLYMNHRDSINPHYIITQREYQIPLEELQAAGLLDAPAVRKLLDEIDLSGSYTKHYYPDDHTLKVFLKGRATLLLDTSTGGSCLRVDRATPAHQLYDTTALQPRALVDDRR